MDLFISDHNIIIAGPLSDVVLDKTVLQVYVGSVMRN